MRPRNIAKRTNTTAPARPAPVEGGDGPVVARATDYPDRHLISAHWHPRAQLLYARRGIMTVTTEAGIFVVPPQRAVWVPARLVHEVRASGRLEMRSLYIDEAAAPGLPRGCCVVTVSPLLRELILAATAMAPSLPAGGRAAHVTALILDEIRAQRSSPLHLPEPRDGRLRRIAAALRAAPGDGRTLAAWGRLVGASARTLARRFQAETGLSFARWRQQARLLEALVRLAGGAAVTGVALDLGYESPSAFIAMFRRALGTTPGRYFG